MINIVFQRLLDSFLIIETKKPPLTYKMRRREYCSILIDMP